MARRPSLRRLRTSGFSLRTRLLLTSTILVVLGLGVADTVTYNALHRFLVQQVDKQAQPATQVVAGQLGVTLGDGGYPGGTGGPPDGDQRHPAGWNRDVSYGTYGALLDKNGKVLKTTSTTVSADCSEATAWAVPSGTVQVALHTVSGTGSTGGYRMLVQTLSDGDLLVVALPLSGIDATLHQLILVELAVSSGVVLMLALASFVLVRRGLRPLERMAATADVIAGGDLSQRVVTQHPKSEVGRLGTALNSMLGQIEAAFEQRTESEGRLRRFVADASHELRTPLTSIRGYAEMFRRGAAARPEDLATVMRRIEGEAERMTGLVEDMLLLARLDQGRPLELAPIDLRELAEDAAMDGHAVDQDRAISVGGGDGAPVVVSGDEPRLRQALANLVRNALVHTPAGTSIEISVSEVGGDARLAVSDHGPGVPADVAEKVFERFFRADPGRSRDRGGSGLGLSVVAAVAEAHDGRVSLEETPGGGATFVLTFPLVVNVRA